MVGSSPIVPAMTHILILLLLPLSSQYLSTKSNVSPILEQIRSDKITSFEREKKLTPLSKIELLSSLREGHVLFFGKEPSKQRLASAWAQVSLENGRGSKIYNFNFGNIGASDKEPHFFISGYRFRSNDSIREGTTLYWKTINKMCSGVFHYFDAGDPSGAAYKLSRCGYYRVDKEHYAKSMKQLYWEALKIF